MSLDVFKLDGRVALITEVIGDWDSLWLKLWLKLEQTSW
jgi:hypothetical protein